MIIDSYSKAGCNSMHTTKRYLFHGVSLCASHTPYPSVLDFWKIKLEKSSWTNWILVYFKLNFEIWIEFLKLIFLKVKIQFVKLHFSNFIAQKLSSISKIISFLTQLCWLLSIDGARKKWLEAEIWHDLKQKQKSWQYSAQKSAIDQGPINFL